MSAAVSSRGQLSEDDDNACADCFYALDEHCENCGECYCENDECLDEDEDENEDEDS